MSSSDITNRAKFIRAAEEAFFLLDGDQDRFIGPHDLCDVAKSVGMKLNFDEALLLCRTALREQTNRLMHEPKLTIDQYSELMLRHVGSTELDDELRATFDALDRDRDGKISREDMEKLRCECRFFDQLDSEQYELVVKELLLYGNDGVPFDQFVQLMMHS